jgi:phosphonate transport system substrate-binding protein
LNKISRWTFAVLLAGTAAALAKGILAPPSPPLRVAFQVCNSVEENRERFGPLCAYLERKLGRKIVASHVNTFDVLERAQRKEFDVLQANGYIYVMVKEKVGASLVAREVKSDTGKDTGGLIVVRADSPVRTVADLKERTMAFGPVLSPGGYLTQYHTLAKAGLDPEKALGSYQFLPGAWQHEKVVYAVLHGSTDAGAVKFGDLERMEAEGKIKKSDFRVVASSEPVPNCTVFALPHVDNATAGKVREALLRLSPSDFAEVEGERLNVLKRDGIKGYVPAEEREFDILRRMAKESGLPPYERF